MELLVLLGWLVIAFFAAGIAQAKGRSTVGWFVLGLFLGPLALLVAALPSRRADVEHAEAARGDSRTLRLCPSCAEPIRREATRCRHCGTEVTPEPYRGLAYRLGMAVGGMGANRRPPLSNLTDPTYRPPK